MNVGSADRKIKINPLQIEQALLFLLTVLIFFLLYRSSLSLVLKGLIALLVIPADLGLAYLFKTRIPQPRYQRQTLSDNIISNQEVNLKIETILRVSQQFATARDEEQVISLGLQLFIDLLDASAASYTPFNERGQTLPVRILGELPDDISGDWIEYLSSPSVRSKCPTCQKTERLNFNCSLLSNSSHSTGVYCVPVRRAERELGIFHFFFSDAEIGKPKNGKTDKKVSSPEGFQTKGFEQPDFNLENESVVRLIAEQTGLAIEGLRLKTCEEQVKNQVENVHKPMDIGKLVENLLELVSHSLNSTGVLIKIWKNSQLDDAQIYQIGRFTANSLIILDELIQKMLYSGEILQDDPLSNNGSKNLEPGALICLPIKSNENQLWGIVAGYTEHMNEFQEDQFVILKAFSAQLALILQNEDNLAELEYQAILQERIRLAREIHDGLAQTLGFLKMRLSQLQLYFEKGEKDKEQQTIQQLYQTVSNAYIETRTTIDQLRVSIENNNLEDLLKETLEEFRESSNIEGYLYFKGVDLQVPGEVNAQLVRIVHEALSNVRKHSHATQVEIECFINGDELYVIIKDNGVGFEPQELQPRSEYGLIGMKERAEIIGADIHINSHLGEGTSVQVRLPITKIERK